MDIEGVRVFVTAAEFLNISAAGRELGLAPAVAGARLSKLEKELGADLLHRSTRKVSLSMAGEEFLPYAKEILAQESAALAALGNSNPEIRGTIRFAASSTFAQLFVGPLLREFLDEHPAVDMELKLTDRRVPLIEGGFDLALRNYAIEDSALLGRRLADDKRILCASPDYLARFGTPRSPEELAEHRLITFMDMGSRKLTSKSGQRECSFPPRGIRPRVVCDDGATMRIAAVDGVGIGMNSLWSIQAELDSGALVRVLPDFELDDGAAIWLVYPKSNALTAKVRVFIDFLLEKIGDPPIWAQTGQRSAY